jgi:hypothetical protein
LLYKLGKGSGKSSLREEQGQAVSCFLRAQRVAGRPGKGRIKHDRLRKIFRASPPHWLCVNLSPEMRSWTGAGRGAKKRNEEHCWEKPILLFTGVWFPSLFSLLCLWKGRISGDWSL